MGEKLRLEVVHEVPGRLRARCPGLRADPALTAALENVALTLPGSDGVSVRPEAESVVFRYSLEDTDPAAFRAALEAQAEVVSAGLRTGPLRKPRPGELRNQTLGLQLVHQVRRWWDQADRQLLHTTSGMLDLRSSVPWVLAFLAIRQIVLGGQLPALPWYTALYYSLQSILRQPGEESEE